MIFNVLIITIFLIQVNSYVYKYILTDVQAKYKKSLENTNLPIIICTGPSGTGKTMLACYEAINSLKTKKINKIIITRPTITVDEDLGFLPGKLEDKLYPFMIPIYDYFLEFFTKDQITMLINNGRLEIVPLAFMRGRTFSDAFIIADEMQNSSPNQFKMLLSRIGLNSKMVITGDLKQNDLGVNNGLNNFLELLNKKYKTQEEKNKIGFEQIILGTTEIKRSPIIEAILDLYDEI